MVALVASIYSFTDLCRDLNTQGINAYDVFNRCGSFGKWCDLKGYGEIDPQGHHRGSSQVWFAEYQTDPEGACKEPPRLNLWHWLLDQFDAKRWTDVSGGRFKDVVITQEIIDQSIAVSSLLSPYVASAGGKLRLRMSVSG